MFQYSRRRMGGVSVSRWWRRRRRLAARTVIADASTLGLLVRPSDPPAVFTPAEDAEVAEGHSSQRTIEATYNRKLSRRLSRLGEHAPQLERRKVQQLHLADTVHETAHR